MVCLFLLAACGPAEWDETEGTVRAGASGISAPLYEDTPSLGNVGPVAYGFDPQRLIRAEIQLDLPPGYHSAIWATKLIRVDRAEKLGEDLCRYGESGRTQACTALQEDGLALALLERPIEVYRRSFIDAGIAENELVPRQLAGARGFAFTAKAEGAGITYGFYPVDERTLLVARRFSGGERPIDPAIGEVLETLQIRSGNS